VVAATLHPSAYVVLGLLDVYGPGTPYDLNRWLETSVGYFWSFPRAQLYVEPQRLADLGLVDEVREASGRRRRRFSITPAGRQALRDWIRSDESPAAELRDPGLLKLFFARPVDTASVVALARANAVEHAQRLTAYERILPELEREPDAAFALATLRLGLRHEQIAVEFWQDIAKNPPRAR
jgi:PadR family transcriptional regulator, regulatory protein AphA